MSISARFERAAGRRSLLLAGFVILALGALVVTPAVFSRRLAETRRTLLDPALVARQQVGQFLVHFSERLILHEHASWDPFAEARREAAERAANTAARALDTLVRPLGPETVRRFEEMAGALRRFDPADSLAMLRRDGAVPVRTMTADTVLGAAHALYEDILSASIRGSAEVLRLEREERIVTAGLSAIGVVATLLVIGLWMRVRIYAEQADAYAEEADAYAEDLARATALRAALVHGVVHDVKNPLGAATGFADLLREGAAGPLNPRQADMVRRLQRLLREAQQTVGEFVELARAQSGEYRIDCYELDIAPIVEAVVDGLRGRAEKRHLSIDFHAADDRPDVRTDPRGVRHVVENVVANAIKYTPAGGRVSVEVATSQLPRGPAVVVRVSDNGPGIPQEYHERVFEPFFRVPALREVSGTGLGLPISKRIASRLGARLAVEDTPGGGATFTLTLPVSGPTTRERDERRLALKFGTRR